MYDACELVTMTLSLLSTGAALALMSVMRGNELSGTVVSIVIGFGIGCEFESVMALGCCCFCLSETQFRCAGCNVRLCNDCVLPSARCGHSRLCRLVLNKTVPPTVSVGDDHVVVVRAPPQPSNGAFFPPSLFRRRFELMAALFSGGIGTRSVVAALFAPSLVATAAAALDRHEDRQLAGGRLGTMFTALKLPDGRGGSTNEKLVCLLLCHTLGRRTIGLLETGLVRVDGDGNATVSIRTERAELQKTSGGAWLLPSNDAAWRVDTNVEETATAFAAKLHGGLAQAHSELSTARAARASVDVPVGGDAANVEAAQIAIAELEAELRSGRRPRRRR